MLWKHFVRVLVLAIIAYFIAFTIELIFFEESKRNVVLLGFRFLRIISGYLLINLLTILLFIKAIRNRTVLRKIILIVPVILLIWILIILINVHFEHSLNGDSRYVITCVAIILLTSIINLVIIERKFAQFDEKEESEVLDQ